MANTKSVGNRVRIKDCIPLDMNSCLCGVITKFLPNEATGGVFYELKLDDGNRAWVMPNDIVDE